MAHRLAFVVEDDADIARMFSVTLEHAGFVVNVVHNGRAALQQLATVVPDLVLLDLNLPSVSGVEILQQIRADERLAQVPVIVTSANPQMADEVYDHADLVLIKPISYEQLRDLVGRFG